METLPQNCVDIDSVDSFCNCISGYEPVDPAAEAFCNRAKIEKNISGDDLAELKMKIRDLEDDACCDC